MSIFLRFTTPKNPADASDGFTLDFSSFLASGETLLPGATVAATPEGLTVTAVVTTSSTITAWLAGGTSGTDYALGYTFQTSGGRGPLTRSAMLYVGAV